MRESPNSRCPYGRLCGIDPRGIEAPIPDAIPSTALRFNPNDKHKKCYVFSQEAEQRIAFYISL